MSPEQRARKREEVVLAMVAKGHSRERAEEILGTVTSALFGPNGRFATTRTDDARTPLASDLPCDERDVR